MPGHFRDFLMGGNRSPGVLIVPQGAPVGRVIESILLVWIASEAAEWVDRIGSWRNTPVRIELRRSLSAWNRG
jgi:hypothetical protein